MNFKTFQLIIDDGNPTQEDLAKVVEYGYHIFSSGSDLFDIENSIEEERFFWMSCQFDDTEIYNDYVWNSELDTREGNPRAKNQIEFRQQLFVCYDLQSKLLYMSNISKRKFLKNYLHEVLQKDVVIKSIIKSIEEFEQVIKVVKHAKFTQVNNIMNQVPESIFKQTANIYGLDMPDRLTLKVDFGNTPIGAVRTAIRRYKQRLDSSEFESVVLVGEDESGLEHSFNFSSMVHSISIQAEKNSNGHFDNHTVKQLLLNKIR